MEPWKPVGTCLSWHVEYLSNTFMIRSKEDTCFYSLHGIYALDISDTCRKDLFCVFGAESAGKRHSSDEEDEAEHEAEREAEAAALQAHHRMTSRVTRELAARRAEAAHPCGHYRLPQRGPH